MDTGLAYALSTNPLLRQISSLARKSCCKSCGHRDQRYGDMRTVLLQQELTQITSATHGKQQVNPMLEQPELLLKRNWVEGEKEK
eukprot:6729213-Pyramimonas_sp.AAC.2